MNTRTLAALGLLLALCALLPLAALAQPFQADLTPSSIHNYGATTSEGDITSHGDINASTRTVNCSTATAADIQASNSVTLPATAPTAARQVSIVGEDLTWFGTGAHTMPAAVASAVTTVATGLAEAQTNIETHATELTRVGTAPAAVSALQASMTVVETGPAAVSVLQADMETASAQITINATCPAAVADLQPGSLSSDQKSQVLTCPAGVAGLQTTVGTLTPGSLTSGQKSAVLTCPGSVAAIIASNEAGVFSLDAGDTTTTIPFAAELADAGQAVFASNISTATTMTYQVGNVTVTSFDIAPSSTCPVALTGFWMRRALP